MNKSLVCLLLGMLAGCSQPAYIAEKLDSKDAGKFANTAGKIQYAPGQYAGFGYDSTGVYGNLHGVNPPAVVAMTFERLKGKVVVESRDFCLTHDELLQAAGIALFPRNKRSDGEDGLSPNQFKWLGQPLVAPLVGSYGRTFWISWKALGLDGPPAEGEVRVYIDAMRPTGSGASFRIGTIGKP